MWKLCGISATFNISREIVRKHGAFVLWESEAALLGSLKTSRLWESPIKVIAGCPGGNTATGPR